MPCSIHHDFYSKRRRAIPGGLYVLSTPESKVYRPSQGYKRAYKVGSSWDLGKRINSYLLMAYDESAGLQLEGALLMNQASTDFDKVSILKAERWVHRQPHTLFTAAKHYPGFSNGQRLNKDRVEWYQGISLRVIKNVVRDASTFGGVFCDGDCDYAKK